MEVDGQRSSAASGAGPEGQTSSAASGAGAGNGTRASAGDLSGVVIQQMPSATSGAG
jgi:hypothetical protein